MLSKSEREGKWLRSHIWPHWAPISAMAYSSLLANSAISFVKSSIGSTLAIFRYSSAFFLFSLRTKITSVTFYHKLSAKIVRLCVLMMQFLFNTGLCTDLLRPWRLLHSSLISSNSGTLILHLILRVWFLNRTMWFIYFWEEEYFVFLFCNLFSRLRRLRWSLYI